MATPHEQIGQSSGEPQAPQIIETPTRYPLELLQAVFDQKDILLADEHQTEQLDEGVHSLLVHPLPGSFSTKYHHELPLLMFNTTIYSPETEKTLKADPVLVALGTVENTYERARAICARRSILMLRSLDSTEAKKDA